MGKSKGAKIGSNGGNVKIGSSGDCAQIGSSGDENEIICSGNNSIIAAIGKKSKVKAVKGCWIVLAEYGDDGTPIHVVSRKIDGKKLKEGIYYSLKNGRIVPVKEYFL